MRGEISDKLDALTVSLREAQDEGKLLKVTNKRYSPGHSQRFVVVACFFLFRLQNAFCVRHLLQMWNKRPPVVLVARDLTTDLEPQRFTLLHKRQSSRIIRLL